ncbi:MAG: GNAT family N-acetyltransferase [Chloroflexi bacterium]|nr:GNAT family N-acetyltransferase [Chloroflexota bacterium]
MSHLEPSLDDNDRERGTLVRKGAQVSLRSHVPANREAFQRWYADPEIAQLLRHDLEPLTLNQSRGYFDTFILPSSARGTCFAIHERRTKRLIGTTALTDRVSKRDGVSALFRIVIGEKDVWGQGYGTEATRLVADEAFDSMGLSEIRLEVFSHNARAISAYTRVGFEVTGEHVEWVPRRKRELRVIEMRLSRGAYLASRDGNSAGSAPKKTSERSREERKRRRDERERTRARRQTERTNPPQSVGSGKHPNGPRSTDRESEPDPD